MKLSYKIISVVILLGLFLIATISCLPSKKRDIQVEKVIEFTENVENLKEEARTGNDSETLNKSENNEISSKNALTKNIASDLEEKTKDNSKIIQKPVSWGYTSSKNRTIDTIIIHSSYNALGGNKYDLDKLIAEYKEYGVSPHYLVDRDGKIYQLVKNSNIAYHAGESKMPDGRSNVNNFSIGIELMNTEDEKFTDEQYDSAKYLISYIKEDYKIKYVLGHNQIASGRKSDPWNFSWSKIESVK